MPQNDHRVFRKGSLHRNRFSNRVGLDISKKNILVEIYVVCLLRERIPKHGERVSEPTSRVMISIGGNISPRDLADIITTLRKNTYVDEIELRKEITEAVDEHRAANFEFESIPIGYMDDVRELLNGRVIENVMHSIYGDSREGVSTCIRAGVHIECGNIDGFIIIRANKLRGMNIGEIASMLDSLEDLDRPVAPLQGPSSARERIAMNAALARGFGREE